MQQAPGLDQAQKQQREIHGLDVALADVGIAPLADSCQKMAALLLFLGRGLDRLDPLYGFRQGGIHLAKMAAHLSRGRVQPQQIVAHGDHVGQQVKDGREQQLGVDGGGHNEGHEQEIERADHQVDAGVEHQVHLAHVVGGPGHQVARGPQVVERHALADQAAVQLVAGITLQPLAQDLGAKVAGELQSTSQQLGAGDDQRGGAHLGQVRWRGRHGVKGPPDKYRHDSGQQGVAEGAKEHAQDIGLVAQDVGQDPTHRPPPVRFPALVDGEFARRHGVVGDGPRGRGCGAGRSREGLPRRSPSRRTPGLLPRPRPGRPGAAPRPAPPSAPAGPG